MNESKPINMQAPHEISLKDRRRMSVSGVREVISFDENAVILKTGLGTLVIHGQGLQLKNLSLDGGQVGVEGTVSALIYEEPRGNGLRRLFR